MVYSFIMLIDIILKILNAVLRFMLKGLLQQNSKALRLVKKTVFFYYSLVTQGEIDCFSQYESPPIIIIWQVEARDETNFCIKISSCPFDFSFPRTLKFIPVSVSYKSKEYIQVVHVCTHLFTVYSHDETSQL